MNRLSADLWLLFATMIWGFGFIAQKDGLGYVGPLTFVAIRFLISALCTIPLVLRESKSRPDEKVFSRNLLPFSSVLCLASAAGVIMQQWGMVETNVTHAAFLTSLYVVFVPLITWFLQKKQPSLLIWPAALLSIIGVWLLAGGDIATLNIGSGDGLILCCALCFAVQVSLIGLVTSRCHAPLKLSFAQYLFIGLVALVLASQFETISFEKIYSARLSLLYAGVISGGIGYTIQAIAQRYTAASDAAIIMSSESLFGAIGGALFMGDHLDRFGLSGCGLIIMAVILVEVAPLLRWLGVKIAGQQDIPPPTFTP